MKDGLHSLCHVCCREQLYPDPATHHPMDRLVWNLSPSSAREAFRRDPLEFSLSRPSRPVAHREFNKSTKKWASRMQPIGPWKKSRLMNKYKHYKKWILRIIVTTFVESCGSVHDAGRLPISPTYAAAHSASRRIDGQSDFRWSLYGTARTCGARHAAPSGLSRQKSKKSSSNLRLGADAFSGVTVIKTVHC
jgi:hypothetical protein